MSYTHYNPTVQLHQVPESSKTPQSSLYYGKFIFIKPPDIYLVKFHTISVCSSTCGGAKLRTNWVGWWVGGSVSINTSTL